MKKILGSIWVLIVMLLMGCKDKKDSGSTTKDTSISATTDLPDSTIYGILGEATGMSCIQIITNSGDTLVLNKESEYTGEAGRILGSIENYSDRFAIVAAEDTQSIRIAINLTQLTQSWTCVSNPQYSFRLLTDGGIQSVKTSEIKSNKWSIFNGKLVFHSDKTGKHKMQNETDTMDILKLTHDSLVVMEKNHRIERFFKTK